MIATIPPRTIMPSSWVCPRRTGSIGRRRRYAHAPKDRMCPPADLKARLRIREDLGGQRQRRLGAFTQRRREHELLGLWAAPPRGPSPSTVSAMLGAKWLASLAPPRDTPTTRRPSRAAVRSSNSYVASRESMPGHTRCICASITTRRARAAHRTRTASNDSLESARMSNSSSPSAGTTLNASPTQDRRHHAQPLRPVRVVSPRHLDRGGRQREQSVPALIGGAAGVGGASGACHAHRARRLARDHHALSALDAELPALEAQAGVVAGEPLDVAELVPAPLLVGDQQQRQLGEHVSPPGERRATPSDSTTPPFMSTVPGPYSRSPSRRSGMCEECPMTVSTWPSSMSLAVPCP